MYLWEIWNIYKYILLIDAKRPQFFERIQVSHNIDDNKYEAYGHTTKYNYRQTNTQQIFILFYTFIYKFNIYFILYTKKME